MPTIQMSIVDRSDNLTTSRETCLQVLRYWHQLEWFSPFNLDDALSRGEQSIDISLATLQSDKANHLLPWLNGTGLFHYQLYLMPFDKKELSALSIRHFPLEYQKQNIIEVEENLNDEGLTCFARLFIDKKGLPKWSGFSVSTLPWAMGMLQSGDFDQLSQSTFDQDMNLLKTAFKILEAQFEKSQTEVSEGRFDAVMLTNLLKILCQWARYSPNFPFVVKIEPIPARQDSHIKPITKAISASMPSIPSPQEIAADEIIIEKDEPLQILNSFFIQDMERVLNSLANTDHQILGLYINGCEEKIDIQSDQHQSFLLDQLKPSQSNRGRWPAPKTNMMSIMQQLCINQSFHACTTQAIVATNGPPGTGKTTLLKDIIAEKIVQRASVLADFPSVKACFSDRKGIVIGDDDIVINILKPELTGFEMLVVSSNNTAVENITRELPLKSSLGEEFTESCYYLRQVAAKLSANHYKQKVGHVQPSLQPWGLIAVALGNSANREEFIQKFFFSPDTGTDSAQRIQAGDYLNIWEWRTHYKGCSFVQARTAFTHALKSVTNYQQKLQELALLHELIVNDEWGLKTTKQNELVTDLKRELAQLVGDKLKAEQSLEEVEHHQCSLFREVTQQLSLKPSFWKRLLRSKEMKLFKQVLQNLQTRRLHLSEALVQLQEQIQQIRKTQVDKQNAYNVAQELLNHYKMQQRETKKRYEQLKLNCPGVNIPGSSITENDHIISYWQSSEFNELRSILFIQALQLHQAWLAEALQKKYFTGNLFAIKALLEGKHPLISSDELVIWQSLFMMIPVASSTFASIGRQFKNLGAESLGWLLIDEAGQAIPQAAVGALWRCKKAVVVGDPRQIEPIMTVPPHLIEGVAKHHFPEVNPCWLPHSTSIQKLADLASPLGSRMQINQQEEWIGIPLLVHRRCLDPMFSIANQIAYESKMINARKVIASTNVQLPASFWFDVCGIASDKQFVPAQAECLLHLFIWFYNHDRGLPQLFIITPFKRIRKHLRALIQNQDHWIDKIDRNIPIPTNSDMRRWLHRHIGTVHTFQGKESEKVIFVLGADKEQTGAIRWASSKPNLLNVALTRATDRIYIIGDWDLWANKPFFSQASAMLERKKWDQLVNS